MIPTEYSSDKEFKKKLETMGVMSNTEKIYEIKTKDRDKELKDLANNTRIRESKIIKF